MAINQNGLGLRVNDFFAVNHRIAIGRLYHRDIGACLHQQFSKPLGTALHIFLMLGFRAD